MKIKIEYDTLKKAGKIDTGDDEYELNEAENVFALSLMKKILERVCFETEKSVKNA